MKLTCPCCGYETLESEFPGQYDVCPICYWEDDPAQRSDMDLSDGSNRPSLREAQKNFVQIGASEESVMSYVREPEPNETKDANWIEY